MLVGCYGVNVYVPLNIYAQCNGIKKWDLWEVLRS